MCFMSSTAPAESYAAYIGYTKAPVNSSIGHFQAMETPRIIASAVNPMEQVLAKNEEAKIVKINKDQGFGYLEYGNGTVFFHPSQLTGCHYSELSVGDVMKFTVVYNFISGKKIAKSVSFVEKAAKVANGHFLDMQPAKITSKAVEPVNVINELNVTGTIIEVNGVHGFIDINHEKIFFHYNQLLGSVMSEIKPGMTVTCNKMFNNVSKKFIAHSVSIARTQPASVGHFIDMEISYAAKQPAAKIQGDFNDKQLNHQTMMKEEIHDEAFEVEVTKESLGLQNAKQLLTLEAVFVRRLSETPQMIIVNDLQVQETRQEVTSRKNSVFSDTFLNVSTPRSRRPSICSSRR